MNRNEPQSLLSINPPFSISSSTTHAPSCLPFSLQLLSSFASHPSQIRRTSPSIVCIRGRYLSLCTQRIYSIHIGLLNPKTIQLRRGYLARRTLSACLFPSQAPRHGAAFPATGLGRGGRCITDELRTRGAVGWLWYNDLMDWVEDYKVMLGG